MRYVPPAGYHSANHHKYARTNVVARTHLRRFHRLLGDRLAAFAPRTILDAGCGEGFGTAALAARFPGARVVGLDASAPAVAFARAHFGAVAAFEEGSVYALPFPPGAFDAVICSEVLEHLAAPDRALAEVLRVAARGAVLSVPREPVFRALSDAGRALGFSPDPGHVNFFGPGQFERFVAAHAPGARHERHSLYRVATVPAGDGRAPGGP